VLTWAKSNYAPLRPPRLLERSGSGLLVPVAKDDPHLRLVAEVVRERGGVMPRAALVKELARREKISGRSARRAVGRAEETWLVRRANERGDPDDLGDCVALPEA
jgi:hypothetical protein